MRLPCTLALATSASLLALAPCARAEVPGLETGRTAYAQGDLTHALAAFVAALADPHADRADVVTANRYLVTLYAGTGDDVAARARADAALALDPTAGPVEGSPTSVTALFDGARTTRGATPLRAAMAWETGPRAGGVTTVRVRVHGAPAVLDVRVTVACTAGDGRTLGALDAVPDGASGALDAPVVLHGVHAGDRIDCVARLATRTGAHLDRFAISSDVPSRAGGVVAGGHGLSTAAWIGIAVAGVAVVAGITTLAVVLATPPETRFGAPAFQP